jgi:hypothetical protein
MGILDNLVDLVRFDPEIKFDAEGNHIEVGNVKKGDTFYGGVHLHFYSPPDPEAINTLAGQLPNIEAKAKEGALNKLKWIEDELNVLPSSTQDEIVTASVGLSALDEIKSQGSFKDKIKSANWVLRKKKSK